MNKQEAKEKYDALYEKRDKMVEQLQKAHDRTDQIRKKIFEVDQLIAQAFIILKK
jgi:chromosome segregation ATPase